MIGKDHGITQSDLIKLRSRAKKIHRRLQARRAQDLGFYDLPHQTQQADAVVQRANAYRRQFDTLVLLGIGGSALGPTALLTALRHPNHNLLSSKQRKGAMRLFTLDNAGPEMIAGCLEILDLSKTLVNVVSKSGGTSESMTAFMIFEQALKKAVGKSGFKERLILTTDPEKGLLRDLANREGIPTLEIPPNCRRTFFGSHARWTFSRGVLRGSIFTNSYLGRPGWISALPKLIPSETPRIYSPRFIILWIRNPTAKILP